MLLRRGAPNGVRDDLPARGTSRRRRQTGASSGGQTLVEFALVFPIFLTLLLGLIEFAFVFNGILAVQFATQNSALIAAEIGDTPGTSGYLSVADCAILQEVERDIVAPAQKSQIQRVDIIWVDDAGISVGAGTSTTTSYARTGSSPCMFPDGTIGSVPYAFPSPNNYPPTARCNYLVPSLAACPATAGVAHTGGPDFIGVQITYTHTFKTPLGTFVNSGGAGSLTFSRSNAVRMEPIL